MIGQGGFLRRGAGVDGEGPGSEPCRREVVVASAAKPRDEPAAPRPRAAVPAEVWALRRLGPHPAALHAHLAGVRVCRVRVVVVAVRVHGSGRRREGVLVAVVRVGGGGVRVVGHGAAGAHGRGVVVVVLREQRVVGLVVRVLGRRHAREPSARRAQPQQLLDGEGRSALRRGGGGHVGGVAGAVAAAHGAERPAPDREAGPEGGLRRAEPRVRRHRIHHRVHSARRNSAQSA